MPHNPPKEILLCYVDPRLKKKVQRLAKKEDRSVTKIVEELVKLGLEKKTKEV